MVARKLVALTLITMGFVTLAAPSASAQGQTVTTNLNCDSNSDDTIRPLGSPGIFDCTVTVQWSHGVTDPANPVTVEIDAQDDQSWMNAILSPRSMTFIPQQSGADEASETQTKDFDVLVSLTGDAPAFETTQLQLDPTTNVPYDDPAQSPQDTGTDIAVTPGYFNLYNVRMDQRIGEGGPDSSVDFPVIIENFSNGDSRFEFSLTGEEVPSGYQTAIPSPVVIRSQASGADQTEKQANFQVFTPFKNGYVNRIASIQLAIDSFYAPDPAFEGTSSQVSTLTKTKGFYVPGPGAPLALLSVLGAALFLVRNRDPLQN